MLKAMEQNSTHICFLFFFSKKASIGTEWCFFPTLTEFMKFYGGDKRPS